MWNKKDNISGSTDLSFTTLQMESVGTKILQVQKLDLHLMKFAV